MTTYRTSNSNNRKGNVTADNNTQYDYSNNSATVTIMRFVMLALLVASAYGFVTLLSMVK